MNYPATKTMTSANVTLSGGRLFATTGTFVVGKTIAAALSTVPDGPRDDLASRPPLRFLAEVTNYAFASTFDSYMRRQASASDFLHDDDLQGLSLRSLIVVIRNAAGTSTKPDIRSASSPLRDFVSSIPACWQRMVEHPMWDWQVDSTDLPTIPGFLEDFDIAVAKITALDDPTWLGILRVLREVTEVALSDSVLSILARKLFFQFPQAVFGLLNSRECGRPYHDLQLKFLNVAIGTLAGIQSPPDTSDRILSNALLTSSESSPETPTYITDSFKETLLETQSALRNLTHKFTNAIVTPTNADDVDSQAPNQVHAQLPEPVASVKVPQATLTCVSCGSEFTRSLKNAPKKPLCRNCHATAREEKRAEKQRLEAVEKVRVAAEKRRLAARERRRLAAEQQERVMNYEKGVKERHTAYLQFVSQIKEEGIPVVPSRLFPFRLRRSETVLFAAGPAGVSEPKVSFALTNFRVFLTTGKATLEMLRLPPHNQSVLPISFGIKVIPLSSIIAIDEPKYLGPIQNIKESSLQLSATSDTTLVCHLSKGNYFSVCFRDSVDADTLRAIIGEAIDRLNDPVNESSFAVSSRERLSEEVKIAVWRRDNGTCVKCGGRNNLEFDHIIPVSRGGANTVRNIELLCQDCNRKKSNKIG